VISTVQASAIRQDARMRRGDTYSTPIAKSALSARKTATIATTTEQESAILFLAKADSLTTLQHKRVARARITARAVSKVDKETATRRVVMTDSFTMQRLRYVYNAKAETMDVRMDVISTDQGCVTRTVAATVMSTTRRRNNVLLAQMGARNVTVTELESATQAAVESPTITTRPHRRVTFNLVTTT